MKYFFSSQQEKVFRQDKVLSLHMREEDTLENTKVDILRKHNHFFE